MSASDRSFVSASREMCNKVHGYGFVQRVYIAMTVSGAAMPPLSLHDALASRPWARFPLAGI